MKCLEHNAVIRYRESFSGYSSKEAIPSLLAELVVLLASVPDYFRNPVKGNVLVTARTL